MTNYDLMGILGDAFKHGEIEALEPHLSDDCIYISELAGNRFESAEKIIERINKVYSDIKDENKYTYCIKPLAELTDIKKVYKFAEGFQNFLINQYCLELYEFSDENPAAIVIVAHDDKGKICRISLSRKKDIFDIKFSFNEVVDKDSPYDLPSTVEPLTPHNRQVKELQRAFSGQYLDEIPKEEEDNIYIWRQADIFIKDWLKNNGYYVMKSQIQEDCIGYRCNRNGYAYTVYMYTYGKEKTTQLDGEYCEKLLYNDFSKNSTVLVVYLQSKRYTNGEEIKYKVTSHGGKEYAIDLWALCYVDGKCIFDYYPRKEMMDRTYQLMYAFNNDSLDVYDCIITEHNPKFNGYNEQGILLNSAFYGALKRLHKEYGDMKLGYVRYNDVVYSSVPYLEGYGFIGFEVYNNNQIHTVYTRPFEGGEHPCAEFIKTQKTVDNDMYSHYPKILEVIPLAPVETERFALKLLFDNGESKKYVLPIDTTVESDEVVKYHNHVFTDKIWQSAKIVSEQQSEYSGYPARGQSITFKNGFFISAYSCYEDSKFYTEPILCNETVYEDEEIKLNRLWRWNVKSVYEDEESGLMKALVSGDFINYKGISAFATRNGNRITSLDFDYITDFSEGLARVGVFGRGYGFINKKGKLVIPAIYENADDFKNGTAIVKRDGERYYIDKTGKETKIASDLNHKYQEVGELCEGMCKVSTLKLDLMDLAYHSDYSEIAGTWGYIDENGNEIVSPQYIYANDFEDGIAIVCKGKWTIDKKWDNEYNTGRYWTEEELWGAIDKTGKEVIPCMFDEIKNFWDTTEVFMAHYGGWKIGKWGVISRTGEWLVEPIFEDLGYEYKDGLFAFYQEDKWSDPDNVLVGVYDLKQHKVILKPQFFDVDFIEDGYLKVEVYEKKLKRRIEKIIDFQGKEVFPSIYSSIYGWRELYEVVIRDKNGSKRGLVDKKGAVILPCKYDVAWNGISYAKRRLIIQQNGKQAVINFEDNVIIPAKYYEIHGLDNTLLTVRDGEKDNYKEGLITHNGTVVVPAEYKRISWCKDNRILCCNEGNCEMLELIIKRESKSD